jgi:TolB protein
MKIKFIPSLLVLSILIILGSSIYLSADSGMKTGVHKPDSSMAKSGKVESAKPSHGGMMPFPMEVTPESLIFPGEKHFANMKQLTFEGEYAEAYFNSDGTKLVYQGHVGSDNCDQIYIMDIETGESKMVSTGTGVTTCSFFKYPANDKIVYASTHASTPDCLKKSAGGHSVAYRIHPEYDIFLSNPDGSDLTQLTDSWGYDAECAFSPDGSSIVWTSLASGDLELWKMNSDGSRKIRLTDEVGYDGGPFFSWDGTKICYRAYHPKSQAEIVEYRDMLKKDMIKSFPLQLWVMNSDGTYKMQVTDNGSTNFCPFFVPVDKRLIFASNYMSESPMDFNLWIVDLDGSNLERLSFSKTFDGFPMFSPDGNKLVFISGRNQKAPRDFNIFVCDWVE